MDTSLERGMRKNRKPDLYHISLLQESETTLHCASKGRKFSWDIAIDSSDIVAPFGESQKPPWTEHQRHSTLLYHSDQGSIDKTES